MHFSRVCTALGGLTVLATLAATPAAAQTFKSASADRHYDKDGKTYFRGPRYVTLGGGASYYNGDLSSNPATSFYSPAIALGYWYRFSPRVLLGVEAAYVKLQSSGIVSLDYKGEPTVVAPISFEDPMYTLTGFVRYNLVPDRGAYAGGVGGTPKVMPFVQAGLGLALLDPNTYPGTAGARDGAEPLDRERLDYPSIIGTLPVGLGLTFQLGQGLSLTTEANYYFTLSDALDDIEFRGSDGNDSYGTAMLKLGYAF